MPVTAHAFTEALHKAGIVGDPDTITRIVIDVRPDSFVEIHVRYVGDTRLLEVTDILAGAEVVADAQVSGGAGADPADQGFAADQPPKADPAGTPGGERVVPPSAATLLDACRAQVTQDLSPLACRDQVPGEA
jgi:hypothetical protein